MEAFDWLKHVGTVAQWHRVLKFDNIYPLVFLQIDHYIFVQLYTKYIICFFCSKIEKQSILSVFCLLCPYGFFTHNI